MQSLFDAIKEFPPMETDEQQRLFAILNESDDEEEVERAREKIINHHIWVACYVVEHYFGKQAQASLSDKEDLVQAGLRSIIDRAVPKFEPDKGFKFSTYARWWAFDGINRLLQKMSPIRVPQQWRKIRKKIEELKDEVEDTDDISTVKQIAKEIGESEKSVKRAMNLPQVEYLGKKRFDNSEKSLLQFVEDSNSLDFKDQVMDEELVRQFENLFDRMTDRKVRVIKKRMGWDGDEQTLRDIGEDEDLSRERIRQIEAEALQEMKELAPPSLKEFLDRQHTKGDLLSNDITEEDSE